MNEVSKQIGQLFILGFPGDEPPPAFLEFISEEQVGGVILFAENCPTHQKTKENIDIIKVHLGSTKPFIAVDQEGGRVCRLHGAPAEYSSPWWYGTTDNINRFREDYSRSAVFMESIGINLNLCPVCDIFINKENSCLVERCFGDTPDKAAAFVKESVEISKRSGLLSCLKHFPGLGAALVDPHLKTAEADYDLFVWQQREKIPFMVGVEAGADIIMTTHLHCAGIDKQIATGSKKMVNMMIRKMLAFDGPVITDDLTMRGADRLGTYGERALAAFNAGHDILLFNQAYEAAIEAYDYFREALERGEVSKEQLAGSLSRVAGLKFKLKSSVVS